MVSDDLTALAAISMGVLTSAALTLSLAVAEPGADARRPAAFLAPEPAPAAVSCSAPERSVVDFAIIRSDGRRSDVQLTVGPESPLGRSRADARRSSLEMRLLRSR